MTIFDETPSNAAEFTVSELSGALRRTVEDAYGHVRVRGEVGRLSRPGSGHVYFDLKDENAVLSAVAWKGVVGRWTFFPEQGLEVVATGRLSTFPGQSRYQIIVEKVEPAGAGALMALLEDRRKRLAAEGLFADARKQLLPFMPRVIGVVTSPTGAVIRDILHRLADRFPLHVVVWPVRVQGETCGAEVSRAVAGFNALEPGGPVARPDVIIVARGGGSLEDLWGFNDETAVRAVAASEIPVIAAVGHETDWTLIDHAADRRAPTPTGAAEMAVPVKADLIAHLATLGARLQGAKRRSIQRRLETLRGLTRGLPTLDSLLALPRQRLDRSSDLLGKALIFNTANHRRHFERQAARVVPSALQAALREKRQTVGERANRNRLAVRRSLERCHGVLDRRRAMLAAMPRHLLSSVGRQKDRLRETALRSDRATSRLVAQYRRNLAAQERMLGSLSHKSILNRGFALVWNEADDLVTRVEHLTAGEKIALQFVDGRTAASVGPPGPDAAVAAADTPEAPRPGTKSPKAASSRKSAAGKGQGSLFD
ncbi:exodeoxyribonuclease VII large subunit [Pseudohoeflea coraliihabitans]|uniref:Exodeoxyribonuclease 7 large subunit n=1 Tax=Pseudohoeflea coraliihabitans TaxID=2860393 RepID=A0ABS6WPV7_9HYPH|nr:exodeoxyribonuclease VII large subunit [Pseudohoeflea sp. DP4N28-3]MBW3097805.1 exodeoxyribonuclease VII large subunit [Pseudohoeflea sp. DP4N28-3]